MAIEKKQKIESLQALRAIAFTCIFLNHANYPEQFGVFGVSVFFVLSGFLMILNHGEDNAESGETWRYAKRVLKLYPLHLIFLLIAVGRHILTQNFKLFWARLITCAPVKLYQGSGINH